MKTILVHGDDTLRSYLRLKKFIEVAKKRSWEVIENELIPTPSLFGKKQLIVSRHYQDISKSELKYIEKFSGNLVIYHEGYISKYFIKFLPKDTKIEEYKLPKIIWSFLDNPTLKVLHKLIKTEPVEFVFTLLARRYKDLYWIKKDPKTFEGQSWQISRLKKQADKYSVEELEDIIQNLAIIDFEVKTGQAELVSALDFMFATKLE
ncbi:hypothetical protein ACFL1Q_01210 [Patescibacteria group bacterium]